MAETFDLLDQLGDTKRVEQLKAKIQKHKGADLLSKLDNIEAEIEKKVEKMASENRTTEDVVREILQANFESLNGNVQEAEKDLQELMLHLRAMLDNCGGEFERLQELNPQEEAVIQNAKTKLEKTKGDLGNAQTMSDAWNFLFGMKNRRIKNLTAKLAASETGVKTAEAEANKSYRQRLREADMKDSLNRIISQVQGMIGVIESMITEVEKQIETLKNRKEMSFATKEKAARVMEDRKNELGLVESQLKGAETELQEMQNGTPAYTEQQKKIADLREKRAEVKGRYNVAFGIHQSKERFVDQIVVHLEAQMTTKNNLKQLIGQLRSDTEERIATYESGLQLVQSATAQEAASIYEEAGVKTDQKITEIAAKVFVSSEEDRIERIKKHPARLAELHKVLVAMAQATQKYKEKDAELMKEHAEKYGIDISEEFSWKHKTKGDGGGPATTKKEGTAVNDLME